jgi:hypothetical protein
VTPLASVGGARVETDLDGGVAIRVRFGSYRYAERSRDGAL